MQLTVENLVCTYAKGPAEIKITLPRLTIEAGRPCALVGVSGSGKSSLLECLGLLNRTAQFDKFELGGVDLCQLSEKSRVHFVKSRSGYMPQRDGLVDFLTVRENFALQIDLANKARAEELRSAAQSPSSFINKEARISELARLAEKLGLAKSKLDCYPHELSIGQVQRASFVRSLAHCPKLLLIDEPTAALDPENGRKLFAEIKRFTSELNMLTLTVTHDVEHLSGFDIYAYSTAQSSERHSVFLPLNREPEASEAGA